MASAWDRLTLTNFSPYPWLEGSYFHRIVGLLARWRQESWLLQWSEAIGAALLSLVFILGPFVTTSLIGVLLIALALYWGLLTAADRPPLPGITPIHLLVGLYWGIAAIAVAFSPVKTAALSGWLKLSLYLLFFVVAARFLRSQRLTRWIITAILLAGLAVSIYGIQQQILGVKPLATWNDPTSDLAGATRAFSYLGNPNLLASYLLPIVALSASAAFVWRSWLQKALAVTMILVNCACLYFTQSRGGYIGLLALIATFLLVLYLGWKTVLPRFWQKWLLPLVLGLATLLGIAAFVGIDPLRTRILSIFSGRQDSSNNFRMNVWSAAIDMIRARPILGIGPGNNAFNKVYPLFMSPKYSALSAYSIYLEILVETGIIGFSAFIWLLATTFTLGIHQIRRFQLEKNSHGFWLVGAIAGIVGILAHGLVDTVWYRPQISTLWWFLVALIASQSSPPRRRGIQSEKLQH